MARNWNNIHVQTAAGSITGSIQKICAGHASNTVTITSWKTGNFKSLIYTDGTTADVTGSQNELGAQGTDDITVAANSCIEGPFMAIHGNGNTVLVYHNGIANTVDD